MHSIIDRVTQLRRPRLLVRAAKAATDGYRREHHLKRLLPGKGISGAGEAILLLLELEHDFEDRRRANGAGYALSDHLEVMIALIAELQQLQNGSDRALPPIPMRPA